MKDIPDGRKPWTNVGYGLNLMLLLGMNYMSLLITQTLQEFQNLQEEEDLNIARIWSLLVDAVAYTSWQEAYKNEKVKYLPQSLESITTDSITIFLK